MYTKLTGKKDENSIYIENTLSLYTLTWPRFTQKKHQGFVHLRVMEIPGDSGV